MYGIIINDGIFHSSNHRTQEEAESIAESVLLGDDINIKAQVFKVIKTMKKATTIFTEGE